MAICKTAEERAARLLEIAAISKARTGLDELNGKDDLELLSTQQRPEINPSYVATPPIPPAFEKNDEPHFVWVMQVLGQGAQGAVYLADIDIKKITREPSVKSVKQLHAIKLIQDHQAVEDDTHPAEVESLLAIQARHPNISQLEAFASHSGHQLVYYPYSTAGDLMVAINGCKLHKNIFPEAFIWDIYRQLVEAVNFLQNPPAGVTAWDPIIHCDIKPENIFLTWRSGDLSHVEYPELQLGDFGVATTIPKPATELLETGTFRGTPEYMAPEQSKGNLSLKTDIWGIGAVLHQMVHFKPPIKEPMQKTRQQWKEAHRAQIAAAKAEAAGIRPIQEKFRLTEMSFSHRANTKVPREMHEFPTYYSQALQENLVELLRFSPNDRVTVEDLMENVPPYAAKMQIAFKQLPKWFQASNRNALVNQLKDKGFQRVPTLVPTKSGAGSEKKRKSPHMHSKNKKQK